MTQPHSFSKDGARRIVNAVRVVEGNDPLNSRAAGRGRRGGSGPEQFIIARVTEIDTADPLFASATEQYWSEDSLEFIDLPGGRVWDGAEGNPPKVRSADGQQRIVDELVTLGLRYGENGTSVWYVLPKSQASFWARITESESRGTGRWRYGWTEVKRATETGWVAVTNGRTGASAETTEETPGTFAINSLEGTLTGVFQGPSLQPVPVGSIVRMHVSEIGGTGVLEYAFEFAPYEVGFGKPAGGVSELPTSDTIELTITDSAGTPILDGDGLETTITVYRNALRRSLYLDFLTDDVFFYVKFAPSQDGVEGCIFSRTEGMRANDSRVPSGGIALGGVSTAPEATSMTGDPTDPTHFFATGHMYYEKSGGTPGGWKPWFTIDPDILLDYKVKTDSDDTTPGFLNDEVIVDPGGGAEFWISKAVDPGGAADNKLLLEHKDPQLSALSLTPVDGTAFTNPSAGVVRLNSNTVPIDSKGHVVSGDVAANTNDLTFTSSDSSLTIGVTAAGGSATVDITGAGSGGSGGEVYYEVIDFTPTASGVYVLDAANHSGRFVEYRVAVLPNTTLEYATGAPNEFDASMRSFFVFPTETTDTPIATGTSDITCFIDASDSHKLKLEINTPPASGRKHIVAILTRKYARKTAVDRTES